MVFPYADVHRDGFLSGTMIARCINAALISPEDAGENDSKVFLYLRQELVLSASECE